MSVVRYISHPEVIVDPATPVPKWNLSDEGRKRAHAMLEQPWIDEATAVFSSGETKALETAKIVADHLGLEMQVLPNSGEIDRSATGFVGAATLERLADRFFAAPNESASGWERATETQRRIVSAAAPIVLPIFPDKSDSTVIIVGHGAVGTLLACHLESLPIDRQYDQEGLGNYWSYDVGARTMLHRWLPIDVMEGDLVIGDDDLIEDDDVIEDNDVVEESDAKEKSEPIFADNPVAADSSAVAGSSIFEDSSILEDNSIPEDSSIPEDNSATEDSSAEAADDAPENDDATDKSNLLEDDAVADDVDATEDSDTEDKDDLTENDDVTDDNVDAEEDDAEEGTEVVEDDV